MLGVPIGVQLPVGAEGCEFGRERQHITQRNDPVLPSVQHQYLGFDTRLIDPMWRCERAVEAYGGLEIIAARARQVQHTQSAEAIADRSDVRRIHRSMALRSVERSE